MTVTGICILNMLLFRSLHGVLIFLGGLAASVLVWWCVRKCWPFKCPINGNLENALKTCLELCLL